MSLMFETLSAKLVVKKAEAILRDTERMYPQHPNGQQRMTMGWFVLGSGCAVLGTATFDTPRLPKQKTPPSDS
ncbi:MAG: hypothetical protein JWM52_581 [Candidatus Saccharibacteria bacterium]|nr:hypothetical protein [Candidatus Saccharibacteria bacterium]